MKILHTADVHIREHNDDRWNALKKLIDVGTIQNIDVMVICGDLFDSTADAHRLRPKIRELFSDLDWPVLMISGNHDAGAYVDGALLGETVHVFHDLLKPVKIGSVYFWGFPYEDMPEEEILEFLLLAGETAIKTESQHTALEDLTHILLMHGELLDISGGWDHYGDEGRQRYLPVKLSYFRELPWQYVLAGHFHTTFDVRRFGKNRYFVYPGSPISITRKETGIRKANLFDVGATPEPFELPTSYFQKMHIQLDPFQHDNPVDLVTELLHHMPQHAQMLLELSGYYNGKRIGMTEVELQRAIHNISGRRVEISRLEFQDVRNLVEDDILKMFVEKLKEKTLQQEERKRVLALTLKAMMELQ